MRHTTSIIVGSIGILIQSERQSPEAREPVAQARTTATRLAHTFRLWDVVVEGAHNFIVHLSKEWTQGTSELITDDGNMICDSVDTRAERPVRLDCLQ